MSAIAFADAEKALINTNPLLYEEKKTISDLPSRETRFRWGALLTMEESLDSVLQLYRNTNISNNDRCSAASDTNATSKGNTPPSSRIGQMKEL